MITKSYLGLLFIFFVSWVQADETLSRSEQQKLIHLLKQDCGSCHGMLLKGGLGPALKPIRMQQLGVQAITATIKYGRPGTAMPPWQAILNDQQIDFLARTLVEEIKQ